MMNSFVFRVVVRSSENLKTGNVKLKSIFNSNDAKVNFRKYKFGNFIVTLYLYGRGGGGGDLLPGSFFATVKKRLALDCLTFVAFIASLLHIIWYTFWSPGT